VIVAEKIDKFSITIGETVFVMSEAGFEIKKGADSLKEILSSLVSEVIGIMAAKNVAALKGIDIKIKNLFD